MNRATEVYKEFQRKSEIEDYKKKIKAQEKLIEELRYQVKYLTNLIKTSHE